MATRIPQTSDKRKGDPRQKDGDLCDQLAVEDCRQLSSYERNGRLVIKVGICALSATAGRHFMVLIGTMHLYGVLFGYHDIA